MRDRCFPVASQARSDVVNDANVTLCEHGALPPTVHRFHSTLRRIVVRIAAVRRQGRTVRRKVGLHEYRSWQGFVACFGQEWTFSHESSSHCVSHLASDNPVRGIRATGRQRFGAPAEAKQFDFLLGQWELEVHPKVSSLAAMIHGTPKLVGTWKAWRLPDPVASRTKCALSTLGQPAILESLATHLRSDARRWKISGARSRQGTHGRSDRAMAERRDAARRKLQRCERQTLTRTRYYDITPGQLSHDAGSLHRRRARAGKKAL